MKVLAPTFRLYNKYIKHCILKLCLGAILGSRVDYIRDNQLTSYSYERKLLFSTIFNVSI